MRIKLEIPKCIGCGTCESLCDKFFAMQNDNKAHLKGGKLTGENEELEITEEGCGKQAAESCPVECIKII